LIPGGLRDGGLAERFQIYLERAAPTFRCSLHKLRPAKARRPAETRDLDSQRLLEALDVRARIVVLDEGGQALRSQDFAERLRRWRDTGQRCDFVIGAAEGLNDSIRQRADLVLRVSTMTLAHELAAVVLAEQLYRAASILRGDPYHRGS
jgi:23S rRNA (pseudouridine1915-N3)-methyltransferase